MKKIIAAFAAVFMCAALAACAAEPAPQPQQDSAAGTEISASDNAEQSESESEPGKPEITYVELSGSAEDSFIAERDCYTEGEKVVLYFQKGVNVRGDMLAMTEKVMSEISEFTGLEFDNSCPYNDYCEFRNMHLEESSFEHINQGAEKINVVIAYNPDNHAVQCAFENGAVLDELDYDFEATGYQIMYHELAHVIHLRNGADTGRMMCEGYAVYITDRVMRESKLPVWSTIQYLAPVSYDASVVSQGESGFCSQFETTDDNYHYGFRLVTFLEETYGKDTFYRICELAEKERFYPGFDSEDKENTIREDTEQLAGIIKAVTSEDVFDRFAEWNEKNWSKEYDEFEKYMKSIGVEVG